MTLLDIRNPYQKAYRVAYWCGCFVLGALGLLLLFGPRTQTIGAVLIGAATTFVATAVMELATLKTTVAELERMLSESVLGTLGSHPTDLDLRPYPAHLHHYSETFVDGRVIWQYAVITLKRLPARIVGYGTWTDPRNQEIAHYSVEVAVRGQHSIFVFSPLMNECWVGVTEIYPFHTGSLSFKPEVGIAMDHAWDGNDHFGRVIVSASVLDAEDAPGILPGTRNATLATYWDNNSPSDLRAIQRASGSGQ